MDQTTEQQSGNPEPIPFQLRAPLVKKSQQKVGQKPIRKPRIRSTHNDHPPKGAA